MKRTGLRNIAIIAHVDHGKTTLVDQMMRQSGLFRESELKGECILDSNDLERERGITILAKNIALTLGGVKVNIIDRPDARPIDVLNAVFDLFVELDADDATLEFPTIYASGRNGVATPDLAVPPVDIRPLYDAILKHVPAPEVEMDAPLQMLVVTLDHSDFVGRIAIGRVVAGRIRKGQNIALLKHDGRRLDDTIAQLYTFDRLGRMETDEVSAGDICAVVGLEDVDIGDTIADFDNPKALPPIRVDEPTLDMIFRINDSPFAGQDGTYVTSRQLRDRLFKELESNVALRVTPSEERRDEFHVSGRGLLHLGILLENMRREGYELSVGKPRVLTKDVNGKILEPIEYLVIEVPPRSVGAVMELVGNRRAECLKMDGRGETTHVEFTIPARGLIGLRTRMLNATSGEAIMHHNFYDYQPLRGSIPGRVNGVMISTEKGRSTAYALENLQERGTLFIGAGEAVYEGQVVGEHCRDKDLPVNVCREKKLTNVRASTAEKTILLKPPRQLPLELALEYIEEDELVEITPAAIRLRKMFLKEQDRRKLARQQA